MKHRWFPTFLAAISLVLLVLAFTRLSQTYSILLFLMGTLVLLRNLVAAKKRMRPDPPGRPRLTTGFGLLCLYYGTLVYLDSRKAVSGTVLGILALIFWAAVVVELRYLWKASRVKRTGAPH